MASSPRFEVGGPGIPRPTTPLPVRRSILSRPAAVSSPRAPRHDQH